MTIVVLTKTRIDARLRRIAVEADAAAVLPEISTIDDSDACAAPERVYKSGFANIRIERFHDAGRSLLVSMAQAIIVGAA